MNKSPKKASSKGGPAVAKGSKLGHNLRTLRQIAGLSINQLAMQAAVSAGMISQIERDQANPSLKILERLRAALNVTLGALLESPELPPASLNNIIRRLGERVPFKVGRAPLIKEMLSPASTEGLRFMTIRFPPKSSSEEVVMDPGQKAGLVLEGQVHLTVGTQRIEIAEGDSFQFDSTLEHSVHNPSDKDALLLWIIAPQGQTHL